MSITRDYLSALALPGINTVYIADSLYLVPVRQQAEDLDNMLFDVRQSVRRVVYHDKPVFTFAPKQIIYGAPKIIREFYQHINIRLIILGL